MRYHQWRQQFNEKLLMPDMPLISSIGEENIDDYLRYLCKGGARPDSAARLFNLRFELMLESMRTGNDGEDISDGGAADLAPSQAQPA